MWSDSAKWSRKTIDGKCDGYMGRGLVGPKSGNVEKVFVFKAFLKGSKKPRGPQRKFAVERAGPKKLDFLCFF